MDTYTVKKAYHWTIDSDIEISSSNLLFCEAGNMSGCQCMVMENEERIRSICHQISDLIRELDILNTPK